MDSKNLLIAAVVLFVGVKIGEDRARRLAAGSVATDPTAALRSPADWWTFAGSWV